MCSKYFKVFMFALTVLLINPQCIDSIAEVSGGKMLLAASKLKVFLETQEILKKGYNGRSLRLIIMYRKYSYLKS